MSIDRTKLIAIVAGLVVAALVYVLWPKSEDDPAALIQRKVIQMARSAEKKDVAFIHQQLSEQFRAQGMSKQEVKGFLAAQILRGNWLRVFVENTSVDVKGAEADFQGKFIFGRSEAKTISELTRESVMGSYRIDAKLVKESDGEWRFIFATWREESVL
ncbi:MAG: hypothetical protein ACT4TC_18220 [Myxococcaceae bacterium]